jgi:hypothetical protein
MVVNREQAPFAGYGESPLIGRENRFVGTPQLCSGVTLRDLIEREGGGIVKEPEGITTPPPATSSERACSKH